MWTSIRWSRTFFALTLTLWVCVLLGSASAALGRENKNPGEYQQEAQSKPDNLTPSPVLRPTGDGKSAYKQHDALYYVQQFLQSALRFFGRSSFTDWVIAASAAVYAFFAVRQWQAIRHQANIAQEALVANRRAFVFTTGYTQFWERDPSSGLYNWRFRPILRNSGDTPTKNLRMYVQCEVRDTILPPGHGFAYQAADTAGGTIPPRLDVNGGQVPRGQAITPPDIRDAQTGKKFIYMWGWIEYFDVFPNTKKHITRYCWLLLFVGDPMTFIPNTLGQPPTPGTMAFLNLHHSEGNCIDEECR